MLFFGVVFIRQLVRNRQIKTVVRPFQIEGNGIAARTVIRHRRRPDRRTRVRLGAFEVRHGMVVEAHPLVRGREAAGRGDVLSKPARLLRAAFQQRPVAGRLFDRVLLPCIEQAAPGQQRCRRSKHRREYGAQKFSHLILFSGMIFWLFPRRPAGRRSDIPFCIIQEDFFFAKYRTNFLSKI